MKRLLCWLGDNREVIQAFIWVMFGVAFMIFEAWLWFEAPCSEIKRFWLIATVPGRCL